MALLLALALACTLTAVLTRTTTAHAAFGRLHEPVLTPVAGVGFPLDGYLGSPTRRKVKLQRRKASGGWSTVQVKKTKRSGRFVFANVVLRRDTTLRVFAPRHRPNPKSVGLAPVFTKTVPVQVVHQSATLTPLPPVAQQGSAVSAPANDPLVAATFVPARPGRKVALQGRDASGWRTLGTLTQDASGSVVFPAMAGTSYRAVASPERDGTGRVITNVTQTRDWAVAFEETFAGTALNPLVWNDMKRENAAAANRTCARADSTYRSVSGGALNLGVGYDPARIGQACQYTSDGVGGQSPYLINTMVATEWSYSFTYGVAAARMKVQRAKGMHSAFWTLPSGKPVSYLDPLDAEIDVMEFFGETPKGNEGVASFVHYLDENSVRQKYGALNPRTADMKPAGDRWWDSYHVFSVEWTPTEYIFRIDGREHYREARGVTERPAFLILSLQTSDYELANLTEDELQQSAQVDWVRVYQ